MPRQLLPILQTIVTVALLAWIFGDPRVRVEASSLWRIADGRWVALGLLAGGAGELAGVFRWWCCLRITGLPVGLGRAAALHFMGLFATLFLPGSVGGDAVKIAWLAAEFPDRKMGGVLAALMDRLSGFLVIIAAAFTVALLRREWFERTPLSAAILHGVLIALAVVAAGLVFWAVTSHSRLRGLHPQWLPMREHIVEISGVFALFGKGGARSLATLALSCVAFTAHFLIFYCAARALAAPVPLADIFSVMPVIDVITMLPITLSGLGLREKSFETLLGALCGVPSGAAVLISLGGFGIYACWSLLGAPVFLCYRTRASHV